MSEKNTGSLLRGAIAANPVLILFLGACPAMAQTTSVTAALGMGVAVLLVMLLSSFVLSLLNKLISEKARLVAGVIVIAGFVSVVQMLMNAFLPDVYKMLGVYLAVAAINLMIFIRAGDFAGENGVGKSIVESLVTGLLFVLVLFVTAAIREVLGNATFAGISIPLLKSFTMPVLVKAPGGFIVFAIVLACINKLCPAKLEAEGLAYAAAGMTCANKEEQGE